MSLAPLAALLPKKAVAVGLGAIHKLGSLSISPSHAHSACSRRQTKQKGKGPDYSCAAIISRKPADASSSFSQMTETKEVIQGPSLTASSQKQNRIG